MQPDPVDCEGPGFEFGRQLFKEALGFARGHLVLDGDMQSWSLLILRGQQAGKAIGQFHPQRQQFRRMQMIGDAASEMDQTG